jgi:hypothetical protein
MKEELKQNANPLYSTMERERRITEKAESDKRSKKSYNNRQKQVN